MHAPLLIAVVALSSGAAPKVALMPLQNGEGVNEATATSLSEQLTGELRKLNAAQIVTSQELSAVLGVERQKQLMGCSSNSCFAELAGALDVDQVITGSVAKVGQSWLLQVGRVDAKSGNALAHASRRKKGGSVDDVLDELSSVAKELFAGMPAQAQPAAQTNAAPPAPAPAAVNATPPPAPTADVPLTTPLDRSKLIVLSDGHGRYLALEPFGGLDSHLMAGDANALYLQRVFGGGSEGKTRFDLVFWEPRAKVPAEAAFDFRDGKYTLTCGQKQVEFKKLSAAEQKKFLARAKLFDVRWQRHGYALARDDDGNYFYVDQAREPEDSTDFALYTGSPGALTATAAQVLAHDESGDLFKAAGGKLKLTRAQEAEWIAGQGRTKLTFLPVEDHARFIYTQLGAYKGLPLGTPCDGLF